MAGRLITPKRATVSAATAAGYLTVDSTTGLYVSAFCWLTKTDTTLPIRVQITEIVSGTSVGVRLAPALAQAPNYGRSDVSAYNGGGFLDQEDQFIYNRNDAPAP